MGFVLSLPDVWQRSQRGLLTLKEPMAGKGEGIQMRATDTQAKACLGFYRYLCETVIPCLASFFTLVFGVVSCFFKA